MFLDDDDFDESPDKKGKGGSGTGGGAKSTQSSSSTSRPGTGVANKDGERVEANFREKGRWYGGKITRDRGDNTYDIAYDFGESESRVKASFIRFNSNGGGSAPSKSNSNNSHFDSKPTGGGDIDDIPMIGSQAAASSNSEQNSRARMLALEREKAQKARTLDSTRMMRRSEEVAESSTSAPSQTTPAFRQFSAPKSFVAKDRYADKSDDEEETFKPKPKDVDNSLRRSSDRDRDRERERERDIERERQRNEDNRKKDSRFDDDSSSRGKGGRDKRDYRDDSDEGESSRHKDGERRSNSGSRSGRDHHDEDSRGGADRDRDRSSPRSSNNEKSPRGGDWDRSDSSNVPKGGVRADRDRDRSDRDRDRSDRGGNSESSPRSTKSKDADKDANSSRWESGPTSTPSPAPAPAPTVAPLNLSDIKRFLCSPVPKANGVVQCYIRRNKNGANKLFPVYSLYLKENDRFLLASKKRANNRTSNYLISMSETDLDRDSANYLGKLRSNFIGTEFQIYDDGVNPEDVKKDDKSDSKVRKELAAITYTANLLGTRGPRKMQVAIPSVDESEVPVSFRDGDPGTDILSRIKEKNFRDLAYLINKPPRWNEQVGAYVLNFNGRVTMASVKNFQLVDPDEQNAVVLQFGRVDKDEFTMDLQWPMSPLQAFGITMSSFDSKIACD